MIMMKIFKNIILVFLLIAALVVVPKTFADITDTSKGTISISGVKENNTAVKIYKLIDVHFDTAADKQQPTEPVYTWVEKVGKWLSESEKYSKYVDAVKDEKGNVTGYNVAEAFNKALSNGKDIAEFYGDLEDNLSTLGLTAIEDTSKKGTYTRSGMDMGHYMVTFESPENKYTYRPTSVNLVPEYNKDTNAWNISEGKGVAKSTTPQVDKKVEGGNQDGTVATAGIGSEVKYTVDIDVPNFTTDGFAQITVSDRFSTGLTYNNNLKIYGVYDGTQETDALVAGTHYTITTHTTNNIADGFDIIINEEQYKNLVNSDGNRFEELHITYSGTVNENAKVTDPITNDVTYNYGGDPKHDTVTVYTYGLDLLKYEKGDESHFLKGAIFNIKDKDGNILKFSTIDGATKGHYRLDANGTTDVEVDDDGTLVIEGLNTGDYSIVEIKAPEGGYIKLLNPIPAKIADDNFDGIIDGEEDRFLYKGIPNSKGFELPVTGGMGTLLFSVLGIVFMGIAVALIRNILKNKKVENI